jgi:flavodoxin
MKKALIVFQSKTGITKKFAGEIKEYISGKGIQADMIPSKDYQNGMADQSDYLLLGCWTAGFMLLFQHPDAEWKRFAGKLPSLSGKKTALFTTYKVATGSMFKSMRKYIADANAVTELKSKKGTLTPEVQTALDNFLA